MKRKPVLFVFVIFFVLFTIMSADAANFPPTQTTANRPLYTGTSAYFVPWVKDPNLWESYTYQVSDTPVNGGTAVIESNKLKYTPLGAYTGTDSFSYLVTDSGNATVSGTAKVVIYSLTNHDICTRISTVNGDGTLNVRTKSNNCAFYAVTTTRLTDTDVPVTMDYFINWPQTGNPKAVVVLIGGGDLNMGLVGDGTTGLPNTSSGGGNFVIRTAQLFADAGYITIAIDKPSDLPTPGAADTNADADQYRISVRHAVDITAILKRVNTTNLNVFLVGTSRGVMSVVANNLIAAGISISSPVTSNGSYPARLYVGKPGIDNLQPSYVQRPVHVMWHSGDLCSIVKPADSQALYDQLALSQPDDTAPASIASGGVRVYDASTADVCGAFDYHGYMGIEPTAVGYITAWLDTQVAELTDNTRPKAMSVAIGSSGGPARLDLSPITKDTDGNALSYILPHTTTSLGGSVSISGQIVTYTPPVDALSKTDYFVYVVTDSHGGVHSAVVTVKNGVGKPVFISERSLPYSSIYEGYSNANNAETVLIQSQAFAGDLLLDNGASVKLIGGYDYDYIQNPGWTTINGKVTIKGGPVTMANLLIR